MKCENCGTKIKGDSLVCPNCGKQALEDEYLYAKYVRKSKEKQHKRKRIIKNVLIVVSIIAIIIGLISGTYLYAENQHKIKEPPVLSFKTGTGIVNEEKVVYLTIDDSSAIECIHGVNIYSGEVTAETVSESTLVSSNYEYTKNSSDSVRSIFFYANDLGVQDGGSYTFTFEMTFGFSMDINSYTYYQPITFSGGIDDDLSDVVFDHKMNDDIEDDYYLNTTEETTTTTTTEENVADYSFVLTGYWYSEPRTEGDILSIDVWEFSEHSAKRTTYTKQGESNWVTAEKNFTFIFNGKKSFMRSEDNSEAYNVSPQLLSRDIDLKTNGEVVSVLEKYNNKSIQNVEDVFGL